MLGSADGRVELRQDHVTGGQGLMHMGRLLDVWRPNVEPSPWLRTVAAAYDQSMRFCQLSRQNAPAVREVVVLPVGGPNIWYRSLKMARELTEPVRAPRLRRDLRQGRRPLVLPLSRDRPLRRARGRAVQRA